MNNDDGMEKFFSDGVPMLTRLWLTIFITAMQETGDDTSISISCANGVFESLVFGSTQQQQKKEEENPAEKYYNPDGSIDITAFLRGFGKDGKK